MRRATLGGIRLACALFVVLGAGPALAQLCGPTDDPCIVSTDMNVPSGSVFNLGSRDLIIAANKTLTVQGAGLLFVTAGDILLDDGARITAAGSGGVGGDVNLNASGAITLDPSSRIDVSAAIAGAITLVGASFQLDGQLRANATTRDGDGGFVSIETTGPVSIGGTGVLGSSGDRFGCGGFFEVLADAPVTVSAPIEFKGGDCDGGDIDIDTLASITINPTGTLNARATFPFGSGGATTLTAIGNVLVNGPIVEAGQGAADEGGGDGGDLDIIGEDVTVNALMDLQAGGPDGSGGFVDITAFDDLTLNADFIVTGAAQGIGGDVLLASEGDTAVNSVIDVQAGFSGGSFDAFAIGNFSTNVATEIRASGTGSPFGQYGGTVDVLACNLTLAVGAEMLATGSGPTPRATIRLGSSGTMTIGGTISAGVSVNLRYRTVPPVFLPGFVISPPPTVTADPTLPCCVACGSTTTSTSSSTSTSLTTSTSTSTTSSTSSTGVTSPSSTTPTTSTSTSTSTSSSSTTLPGPCGAPMSGCRAPTDPFKAKLSISDNVKDSTDKIVWKWLRGQATAAADFGDPLGSDAYAFCMWNVAGSPVLIGQVDAPAGGLCDGKPCWRTTGRSAPTGYKYVDPLLTPNGGQKIVLKAGSAGKAKAVVKGKGALLDVPALPLTLPLRVQLQGAGGCFETYFFTSGVLKNTAEAFEGRAGLPSTTTTSTSTSTSSTSPLPVCGNGARELPEQCDDGNLVAGDCCSPLCTAEPTTQPCTDDGNVCTLDRCDGLGACAHPAGNAGLTCRPAEDQCDAAEQCTGLSPNCPADGALPNGTSCDATMCLTGETCTAGTCGGGSPVVCPACESCDETDGCVAAPVEACRQTVLAGKSSLLIKDRSPDDGDKVIWKWARGEETMVADFGTPAVDDNYAICLFDETTLTPALVTRLLAPAAGACGGSTCWRSTSSGFKYVDAELTPDGVRKLLLKSGATGSSAITLKAKGLNVPMPTLPLGSVLRLQLQGNGECWEATFSPGGISENTTIGFEARSD